MVRVDVHCRTVAGKKIADYWDSSKRLLMDSNFIHSLKDFDRDNIPVRNRPICIRIAPVVAKGQHIFERSVPATEVAPGRPSWWHRVDYKRAALLQPRIVSYGMFEFCF